MYKIFTVYEIQIDAVETQGYDKLNQGTGEIMRKRNKTWITSAHQGFADENLHSNTLAAYKLAAKKGADMIEIDARRTKDGG